MSRCKQKQKVKPTNLVTKEYFNNFTSFIEKKITSGPNFIKECGKETFADIDDLNLLKMNQLKNYQINFWSMILY